MNKLTKQFLVVIFLLASPTFMLAQRGRGGMGHGGGGYVSMGQSSMGIGMGPRSMGNGANMGQSPSRGDKVQTKERKRLQTKEHQNSGAQQGKSKRQSTQSRSGTGY